jgi:predicted nucleic acid-binding protein
VIYLDSSVALATLLAEPRAPAPAFWRQPMVTSRLLAYEVAVRLNALGLAEPGRRAAERLASGLALVELTPPVLERALQPFPVLVRTLDALHLATMDHLRGHGQHLRLASYDRRVNAAARAMGFGLAEL